MQLRSLGMLGLALSLVGGCGGGGSVDAGPPADDAGRSDAGSSVDDAGAPSDAGPLSDAGPPVDAGPLPDAGSLPDAGPVQMCSPSAGSALVDAYCDNFHLAVIDDGSGNVRARLSARIRPDGLAEEGCAVLDSVEVFEGPNSIGTLQGLGDFSRDGNDAPIAEGPALPAMVTRCAGDEGRFNGFGFVVRGRMDGGSFEADCADRESGNRWPPALVTTCHENVDAPAVHGTVIIDSFGGAVSTSFDALVPHGPGGALTSVSGGVRIIGEVDPFGGGFTPAPFDVSGLNASVFESSSQTLGTYTGILAHTPSDPLGQELCPPGWNGIGEPPLEGPPVLIVRFTGAGERGPFTTEAYVDQCSRAAAP